MSMTAHTAWRSQRTANAQAVETVEQLTDASWQVPATAQQIATAASHLADLSSNRETTATGAAAGNGYS